MQRRLEASVQQLQPDGRGGKRSFNGSADEPTSLVRLRRTLKCMGSWSPYAFLLPRSKLLLGAIAAASSAGVAFVLLDVLSPPSYHRRLIIKAGARVVVSSSHVISELRGWAKEAGPLGIPLVLLDEPPSTESSFEQHSTSSSATPVSPWYLMCTSGSTRSHSNGEDGLVCVRGSASASVHRARWRPFERSRPLPPVAEDEARAVIADGLFKLACQGDVSKGTASSSSAAVADGESEVMVWKTPLSFVDTIAEFLTPALSDGKIKLVILPETEKLGDAAERSWESIIGSSNPSRACAAGAYPSTLVSTPAKMTNVIGRLARLVANEKATQVTMIPSMLLPYLAAVDLLATSAEWPLPSLRTIHVSGEPLSWEVVSVFYRRILNAYGVKKEARFWEPGRSNDTGALVLPRLVNVYGCTETTADATFYDCSEEALAMARSLTGNAAAGIASPLAFEPVPAGIPFPGTSVRLRRLYTGAAPLGSDSAPHASPFLSWTMSRSFEPTESARLLRLTDVGRIVVKGAAAALGYLGDEGVQESTLDSAVGGDEGFTRDAGDGERMFITSDCGYFAAECQGRLDGTGPAAPAAVGTIAQLPATCPCGCGATVVLVVTGRVRASTGDEVSASSGNSAIIDCSVSKVNGVRFHPSLIEACALESPSLTIRGGPTAMLMGLVLSVTFAYASLLKEPPIAAGERMVLFIAVSIAPAPAASAGAPSSGAAEADLRARLHPSAIEHIHTCLSASLPKELVPRKRDIRIYTSGDPSALQERGLDAVFPPLPSLPSGKVNRRVLREAFAPKAESVGASMGSSATSSSPAAASITDATEEVSRIFPAILGSTSPVGLNESFWDLGGDSLKGIILLQALRQRWPSAPIDYDTLLTHATPGALAAFISGGVPTASIPASSSLGGMDSLLKHPKTNHAKPLPIIPGSEPPAILEAGRAGRLVAWAKSSATGTAGGSFRSEWSSEAVVPLPATAFEPAEAKEMWSVPLGKCVDAAPLIVRHVQSGAFVTIAITGSHDCNVYAFQLADTRDFPPKLLWMTGLPDRVEGSAVLHPHTGTALVPCYDGCLYALELFAGIIKWAYDSGAGEMAALTSSSGLLAGGGAAHTRHVELEETHQTEPSVRHGDDPETSMVGRPLKRQRVDSEPLENASAIAHSEPRERAPLKASPCVIPSSGDVYICGHDKHLSRLRLASNLLEGRSMELAGRISLPSSVVATPVLTSSDEGTSSGHPRLLVATLGGQVMAFDSPTTDSKRLATTSSKLLWQVQLDGPVFASPAVSALGDICVAVVGSADGTWCGLNATSGAVLWKAHTSPVPATSSSLLGPSLKLHAIFCSPIIIQHGGSTTVVCGADDGIVRGLDVRTGAVVWSCHLSALPSASPTQTVPSVRIVASPLLVCCTPICLLCMTTDGMAYLVSLRENEACSWAAVAVSSGLCIAGDVFASPVLIPSPPSSPDTSAAHILVGAHDDHLHCLKLTGRR